MLHHLPIVYFEDQETDLQQLKRALQETRHQGPLIHLAGRAEALAFLQENSRNGAPLGLMLVKVRPHVRTGLDLIRSIRAQDAYKKVPVIAIAGEYFYDDLDAAYAAGANLVVIAPKDPRGWADLIFRLQDYFSTPYFPSR